MIASILSVGGWTMLSRVVGFARDVLMAAVLGAGPIADAFVVAFRLPNHFRAILGEGAFNSAFVPSYARIKTEDAAQANLFSGRLLSFLLIVNAILLAVVWLFTPQFVGLLAPGLRDDPERFALTIEFIRITFPYLGLMTLTTLYAAILNAASRFATAAAAPTALNICMLLTLSMPFLFPTAGHAASWGVLAAGFVQFTMVGFAAHRAGLLALPARPRLSNNEKRFFIVLAPAVIGSAGTQIAMFADTLLASFLPTGSVSALYYADRLYQLPIGVIAVAAGTVLLSESSRLIAQGDFAAAASRQSRAIALILLLGAPCFVAFLMIPDLLISALFARGAFSAEAVNVAANVLFAYAIGLPALLLIRTMTVPFFARGDTKTPMIVALLAIALNVGAKFLLMPTYGAGGLALATSLGAWINFCVLAIIAHKRGFLHLELTLSRSALCIAVAASMLALALITSGWAMAWVAGHKYADELRLLMLMALGGAAYLSAIGLFFKLGWLRI